MVRLKHPQSRADRRLLDSKYKRNNKRKTSVINKEVEISVSNIEAQIIAFLYATTILADDEEVLDMIIGDGSLEINKKVILKLKIKKMEEVKDIDS